MTELHESKAELEKTWKQIELEISALEEKEATAWAEKEIVYAEAHMAMTKADAAVGVAEAQVNVAIKTYEAVIACKSSALTDDVITKALRAYKQYELSKCEMVETQSALAKANAATKKAAVLVMYRRSDVHNDRKRAIAAARELFNELVAAEGDTA